MTMAKLSVRNVVKMPVEAQAADALRESIVAGHIAPGSRITEIQLAEQMQLSRATIRTALHQLASEGLISLVPYTGWTVVPLSAHDAWELYTLRSSVERLAGQLAATAEDRAPLAAAFDRLLACCRAADANADANADAVAEADFALHKTIIDITGHRRLAKQYALIEQQVRMYIRSSDALVAEPAEIIDQHRPIVEAILAGDAEEAGRRSEAHNLQEGEKLAAFLRRAEAQPKSA
jgi:DNA-binding GntR family transcriptional regulator